MLFIRQTFCWLVQFGGSETAATTNHRRELSINRNNIWTNGSRYCNWKIFEWKYLSVAHFTAACCDGNPSCAAASLRLGKLSLYLLMLPFLHIIILSLYIANTMHPYSVITAIFNVCTLHIFRWYTYVACWWFNIHNIRKTWEGWGYPTFEG